jgi:hypothetical protein
LGGVDGAVWAGAAGRVILVALLRFASTFVLAVCLLQAVSGRVVMQIPCAEQCEDDGPDGQCAPTCEDCLCCAHSRAAFSAAPPDVVPLQLRAGLDQGTEGGPPEAEIQEILRVPKRAG